MKRVVIKNMLVTLNGQGLCLTLVVGLVFSHVLLNIHTAAALTLFDLRIHQTSSMTVRAMLSPVVYCADFHKIICHYNRNKRHDLAPFTAGRSDEPGSLFYEVVIVYNHVNQGI